MANQELTNYIKESREKGFSDEQIKKALLDAGWAEDDVNEGLKNVSEPIIPKPPEEVAAVSAISTEPVLTTETIQKKASVGRIIKHGFWGFVIGILVGGFISLFTLKSFYLWIGIIIVFTALFVVIGAKSKVKEPKIVSEKGLSTREKIIAIIFCIINPVITGAIMYFMWRKRYPRKARQANHISFIIFLIELVGGLIIFGID